MNNTLQTKHDYKRLLRPLCWILEHDWHVNSCLCCAICQRCHMTNKETSLGKAFIERESEE